ncbi:MAG: hypothetical protein AB7U64_23375 [Blastocatellales bacterium]
MDATITLGGQEFPVPVLTLGQLKTVVPALLRLKDIDYEALTEANMIDLANVVYVAVSKKTPIARPDFDNLSATLSDLFLAIPIIATQAGMLQKKPEAAAETSTGTTS